MKTRILFVNHTGMLGGGELSLLDIAGSFGSTCTTALFSDGPLSMALQERGVQVHRLTAGGFLDKISRTTGGGGVLMALPSLLRGILCLAVLARRHDLIYANSQKAFVVSSFAGILARKKVVWHLRDLLSEEHFGLLMRRLVVTLANCFASRVIANSRATAVQFIQSGGRASKVRVVYNGIDSSAFSTLSLEDIFLFRQKLGLSEVPVIGMFSRICPWKGQHVVVEALSSVPNVQVLFVGDALFGEDDYAESIKKRVVELGLSSRVHFLGFRSNVGELTQIVDIVVHASTLHEPFGRVIVEGMMAGKPVIATSGGGVDEIIENGKDGILVSPGDVDGLVKALKALLSAPDRARAIGVAAKIKAENKFSLQSMLAGVGNQIYSLLSIG